MYKILFLILLSSNLFSFNKAGLVGAQFNDNAIDESLKDQIPFLQLPLDQMNSTMLSEKNLYTLNFQPSETLFPYFSKITGMSIFQARFIVSWYVFTNNSQIPSSTDKMMELVNVQKPIGFATLVSIGGKWKAMVELPYTTLKKNTHVYVYISYPNNKGVLVPIAGQVFPHNLSQNTNKEQVLGLSTGILSYWKRKGYL